jgi:hypothetical protein
LVESEETNKQADRKDDEDGIFFFHREQLARMPIFESVG